MDSDELYELLMQKTLNYVSFRPRSRREVQACIDKTLKRVKSVDTTVVKKVLHRLSELGYLDDSKFASWWITQRNNHRPKGLPALQFELQSKGIHPAVTASAYAAIQGSSDGETELELAKRAIQKKIIIFARLPIIEQKKKIYAFLALRGFSGEIIGKIIDELYKKEYNESTVD